MECVYGTIHYEWRLLATSLVPLVFFVIIYLAAIFDELQIEKVLWKICFCSKRKLLGRHQVGGTRTDAVDLAPRGIFGGLRWQQIDCTAPPPGRDELIDERLSEALRQGKYNFTNKEWDAFGDISDKLRKTNFVKTSRASPGGKSETLQRRVEIGRAHV